MAVLQFKTILTPEERLEKRKLILRDTVSLLSLFMITAVLFTVTLLLFRSFTDHRQELAVRWLARGDKAMQNDQPVLAIQALHSALAYDPNNRSTEIKLATALAYAGRTQEAAAYFNTLREAEPGNGMINLELARIAAKQGNVALALQNYQTALDGTWQGDGYTKRREVRLEMARYLIANKRYEQARNQLLIAAGNAPDDAGVKLGIAALLEQAQAPLDALELYRKIAEKRPTPLAALEGGGRTAFTLGRYSLAKQYLDRALNHPDFDNQPQAVRDTDRNMAADAAHILLLNPSPELSIRGRALRVANAETIAEKRFASCGLSGPDVARKLTDLAARWQQVPANPKVLELEQNPELEQSIMKLVFDTERRTAEVCGPPTGNDALLLKLAQAPIAPMAMEQE
jgi:tetratricopeptide (TPR) repeat protein